MKTHSIKFKLTLWFSCAVIIISCFSIVTTLLISRSVLHREIRDDLIRTVEGNLDEVEYYKEYDRLVFDDPYDIYINYGDGFLEIDDDFVRSVNGIASSLYDDNGLLYGDSSQFAAKESPDFADYKVSYIKSENGRYYVYDRKISLSGCNDLWLRGTVPAESSISQVSFMVKIIMIFIPFLIILAIVGGYFIAKRALRPVDKINDAAESISEGNDLSRRIDIGEGNNELNSIANSFNAMLERLENSFKKEQQLTSDISHELRTPISVIYSQCQLSLETDTTQEEFKDSIALIERQSKKMSGIINDMLAFSRLERGAEKIRLEDLDLSQCVSSVCEDMSLIDDKGIELKYDIEPDILINGSFELITRMAVNLISNAYRYGKQNGEITVTLLSRGEYAELCVKDNGIGISQEDITKIFDRFYRSEKSRSSGGTGLGLSFVKEIAEIHSAEISVDSELDVGSSFKIIFKKI